jgi:hypothetical protein
MAEETRGTDRRKTECGRLPTLRVGAEIMASFTSGGRLGAMISRILRPIRESWKATA